MTTPDHDHVPRNGAGQWVRQLSTAERDAQAAVLAAQGMSYRAIAERLGYSDAKNAWRGATTARRELTSMKTLAQVREEQLLEISELRAVMWETVRNPPPSFDRVGRLQRDEDGAVVPDEQARQGAAQVIARLEERLAKLVGSDAPKMTPVAAMNDQQKLEIMQQIGISIDASPEDVYGGSVLTASIEA